MGRAEKRGLDYFPLDTEWDIKMQLVKARFGLVGIGCIVELFKLIYHEGYALKWDEDTRVLFAASNHIDEKTLGEIVIYSVEKGVFHAGIFDKLQVLSSSGIQKRWKKIVKSSKRAVTEIDRDLDLNTARWCRDTKTPEEIEKTPEEKQPLCGYTPGEIPQTKVKENKEEYIQTPADSDQPLEPVPASPSAVAVVKKPTDPLYQAIWQSFTAKTPTMANYAAQGKATHRLVEFVRKHADEENAPELARQLVTKYWELTQGRDRFWTAQPFTPMNLSAAGILDRVLLALNQSANQEVDLDTIPF